MRAHISITSFKKFPKLPHNLIIAWNRNSKYTIQFFIGSLELYSNLKRGNKILASIADQSGSKQWKNARKISIRIICRFLHYFLQVFTAHVRYSMCISSLWYFLMTACRRRFNIYSFTEEGKWIIHFLWNMLSRPNNTRDLGIIHLNTEVITTTVITS